MDFIKEKLNIWRNYGFEAKEIRFLEFSLAEYNAKVLINCLCIGIPIMFLLICVRSVALGFEKANVWPMVLAIIIFVYLLDSTKDLLKSRIRLKKHIHELTQIFIWTIYGMALYYDIVMRPGEINGMLCAIFIGMELIFAEYPENHLKMVLYAYLLTICVELLYEHGEIMVINLTNSLIAMLVGLYVSWNQSRDRFTILLYRCTEGSEEEQRVRTQMMLTQIRPHFIYNILASIQVLCLKDPQKAAGAVACFSSYLRGNMDSIGNENLVPFPYELAHVENYVTLERIRFGEKLKVCYEFEKGWDMDFDIPVLSLQPIVENAIKYGVGDKKGGGTVWISVRREGDSALVEIRDDGVGVDARNLNELPIRDDGKTHVGLHNVQARVKLMAGGSLEFFSKKDWGTIVTIKVPWRRKTHEHTGS
mgnify:FL=1